MKHPVPSVGSTVNQQLMGFNCAVYFFRFTYCRTKKNLFEKTRQVFDLIPCQSMDFLYRIISKDIKVSFIFDSESFFLIPRIAGYYLVL
jgi:hypothetical protein